MYPLATILACPCRTVRLANLLEDKEIAQARDGCIVAGEEGDYFEFIQDHLQGCLVGRTVFSFPSKIKLLLCHFLFHSSAW